MKSLLAVGVVLGLAGVAAADPLLAYEHDGKLTVAKVGDDAVTTLFEEPNAGVLEYGFSTPDTLWVVRVDKGVYSVEKIVGDKVEKRVLTPDVWKAKPGKPAPRVPKLMFTQPNGTGGNEAWIHRCVAVVREAGKTYDTCPERWLRLDLAEDVRDKAPPDLRYGVAYQPGPDAQDGPQKLKGPKGYTFAISQHGFSCTAPKHTENFKGGTRWIYGAMWISPDPAIVHFFVGRNGGFEDASDVDAGAGEFFLEDCHTYLVDVKVLDGGAVASTEGDGKWIVRKGQKQIGAFTATHVEYRAPTEPAPEPKK